MRATIPQKQLAPPICAVTFLPRRFKPPCGSPWKPTHSCRSWRTWGGKRRRCESQTTSCDDAWTLYRRISMT